MVVRSLVCRRELRASENTGRFVKIKLGGNSLERPFTNRNSVVGEICHAC